ncbi:uncharacterized protein [Haliotis asinina]|uniref:uncharacterized protein n=1 Tax=Haliotis asinina TaxID=109174 RepID=UPI003532505A
MMADPSHGSPQHKAYSNVRFGPGHRQGPFPAYDMRVDGGTAVRNTVKNMVSNLENVITNLHGIVGDLRVLVHQIDVVTNKIDGKYGVYWEKSGLNHVSNTHEKVSKAKDMDSFGVCRWKMLREKYDSTEFSPDIDWSYLGLGECNKKPDTKGVGGRKLHSKKLRRVKHMDSSVDSSGVSTDCDLDNDDFRLQFGSDLGLFKSPNGKFDLHGDINFDCLEMDGHSSDLDSDVKASVKSRNISLPAPVPQHAYCRDVTGGCTKETYCGMYESLMESKLETLSNCDANSEFSEELEDDLPPVVDDVPSVKSLDFEAEYNRHVNPWTSFGLVHIDSTQESDEVLSESASDILNDNYIETSYINPGFDDVQPLVQQTIC